MNHEVNKRWLILPIEVKARELDGKLLLACEAACRGFGVLVGPSGFNKSKYYRYPKGIYFDKCLSPHKEEFLTYQVKTLGNKLVSLDEEGLLYISDASYIRTRISQELMRMSDLIFCWGQKQQTLLTGQLHEAEKLILAGAPRVDIWRQSRRFYRKEIADLRRQFGKFILVSSNFGMCRDEFDIPQFVETKARQNLAIVDDSASQLVERLKYFINVKDSFLEMIRKLSAELAKDGEFQIVIRPHPSDDSRIWAELEKENLPLVTIRGSGSISPLICAAEALIHNNCTSAVEAWFANVPTIAYLDYSDSRFEYGLPNNLGMSTQDVHQVMSCLKRVSDGESFHPPQRSTEEAIRHFIQFNENRSAVSEIVDALFSLETESQPLEVVTGKLNCPVLRVKATVSRFLAMLRMRPEERKYRKQKNPGITQDEITDLISVFNQENNMRVVAKKLHRNVFCVYADV